MYPERGLASYHPLIEEYSIRSGRGSNQTNVWVEAFMSPFSEIANHSSTLGIVSAHLKLTAGYQEAETPKA